MLKSVLFDLDGTLIDSADGVIFSLREALNEIGCDSVIELTSKIIGPPLPDLINKVCCDRIQPETKALAIKHFKKSYDSIGYKKTNSFDGIERLLENLSKSGFVMYIVTNKRESVTKKIISRLGWTHFFKSIYCIDMFHKLVDTKTDLLKKLLDDFDLDPCQCVYIGDTLEDKLSSELNRVRFIPASWNVYGLSGGPITPDLLFRGL